MQTASSRKLRQLLILVIFVVVIIDMIRLAYDAIEAFPSSHHIICHFTSVSWAHLMLFVISVRNTKYHKIRPTSLCQTRRILLLKLVLLLFVKCNAAAKSNVDDM